MIVPGASSAARFALTLCAAAWLAQEAAAARRHNRTRRAENAHDTTDMLFGRALAQDWNFEQNRLPPMRETVQLQERTEVTEQGQSQLVVEFIAFGKRWTMRLRANDALLGAGAVFETRTRDGLIVSRHPAPRAGCFYLGTVYIDDNEYGHASVTTCNNSTRALVITNANDYVLFPWNWKIPYHLRHRLRHPRETQRRAVTDKYILEVANLTEYRAHLERLMRSSLHRRRRRQQGRAKPVKFPRLYPLREPPGRLFYLKVGLVMDKWYISDFKRNVSLDNSDLIIHAAELINNAQLWYLHPTFGFQMWLILKAVVLVHDDIGGAESLHANTFIDSCCKWVRYTFPDQNNWDAVLLLSSKEGIWNNRVGLSQRSGVCSPDGTGRCSGVSHLKFQMASLARLVAHELLHPLGVADDYEGSTSEHCFTGIMRLGVWQDHDWSVCSVQELERFLEISTSRCVQASAQRAILPELPVMPVNVAWRAKAEQSSTYGTSWTGGGSPRGRSAPISSRDYLMWGAWKATDGGLSGPPRSQDLVIGEDFGSCTQTREENEPWLTVELQQQYWSEPIQLILLYNRDDCCSERLRDFEVRIGFNVNFTLNPQCYFYNGTVPGGRYGLAVVHCATPLKGRYITIQIKRPRAILTLCEVQVLQEIRLAPYDSSGMTCVDHHPYCPYWSSTGECSHSPYLKFMEANCSYSCGFCERADAPPWGPSAMHAPPQPIGGHMTAQVAAQSHCRDKHEYCLHVAANGDCHSTFEMVQVCAQSCGFCSNDGTSGGRADSFPARTPPYFVIGGPFYTAAPVYPVIDEHGTAEPAKTHFATTSAAPPCYDGNDHCKVWRSRGYCNLRTIQMTCRLSCDTCSAYVAGGEWIVVSNVSSYGVRRAPTTTIGSLDAGGSAQSTAHRPAKIVDSAASASPSPTQLPTTEPPEWQHVDGHRSSSPNAAPPSLPWAITTVSVTTMTTTKTTKRTHTTLPRTPVSTASTAPTTTASTTTTITTTPTTTTTTPITTTPITTTPTLPTTTTRRPCVDRHRACGVWAAAGHCIVADSVRRACPSSCFECRPTDEELLVTAPPVPTCRPDRYPSCPSWARHGHCFQERVIEACPTSCRRC